MRRWRRISEFGEAEFLGASFHDAPQSARQRLAALPFAAGSLHRGGNREIVRVEIWERKDLSCSTRSIEGAYSRRSASIWRRE